MPTRPQIELSKEELLRAEIPVNHVLVKLIHKSEGLKTRGGITIGFNTDTTYASDEKDSSSHPADTAEVYGIVVKTPKSLYFNKEDRANSMDWDIEMELMVGDYVWFSVLESKNATEVVCEGITYRSIPYQDCYVAKRNETVIALNGYVLLEPCFCPVLGDLDHLSKKTIDMTRGIIKFVGTPPNAYIRENFSHIDDLRVGDEVLFEKRTPLFYLERTPSIATFMGNTQFWVTQRRRIVAIINRK